MITMRNNWEEKDMSHAHHGQVDEKRLCDYNGISTDRPISAPPPSGMGFNVSSDQVCVRAQF